MIKYLSYGEKFGDKLIIGPVYSDIVLLKVIKNKNKRN